MSETRKVALGSAAALTAGGLSSIQSRANGELSQVLASPIAAAVWSFGSGMLLLTLGLVHPSARRGLRRVVEAVRQQHLQWWELVGGIFGGVFVAVQTFAVPAVGVALFTVALVGGQTANALLVDRFGLGPAGRSPVTPARAGAAVLTFAGVAVAATSRGSSDDGIALLPVVLTALAGCGLAVQAAINGKVNRQARQPMATTWINFAWGTGFLLSLAAVELVTGHLRPTAPDGVPWWTLLGGIIGIVFIVINTVVVAQLGVLVLTLLILTGQLLSAVVLDLLFPTPGTHLNGQLVLGVTITLLAAGGAAITARRG